MLGVWKLFSGMLDLFFFVGGIGKERNRNLAGMTGMVRNAQALSVTKKVTGNTNKQQIESNNITLNLSLSNLNTKSSIYKTSF